MATIRAPTRPEPGRANGAPDYDRHTSLLLRGGGSRDLRLAGASHYRGPFPGSRFVGVIGRGTGHLENLRGTRCARCRGVARRRDPPPVVARNRVDGVLLELERRGGVLVGVTRLWSYLGQVERVRPT
jgi:hypothetical protein